MTGIPAGPTARNAPPQLPLGSWRKAAPDTLVMIGSDIRILMDTTGPGFPYALCWGDGRKDGYLTLADAMAAGELRKGEMDLWNQIDPAGPHSRSYAPPAAPVTPPQETKP